MTSRPARIALVFAVSFLAILAQALLAKPRQPVSDEHIYIAIAHDLGTTGIFSDGPFAPRKVGDPPRPGRFFAPVYPAFLAGMARLDPAMAEFIACHATKADSEAPGGCSAIPASLMIVQAAMGAAQLVSILLIALLLSGSLTVGLVALGLGLATGEHVFYARACLSENTAFLGFFAFLAAGVAAFVHRRVWHFAAAGGALALATLTRPSYLYLLYLLAPVLFALAGLAGRRLGIGWRHGAAFALAGAIVLLPWMARNQAVFGDAALTAGYAGYILVQRIAYNAMTWQEWGISFLYWLPDFGDGLARWLFEKESYVRLGFNDPTSFYLVGNRELRAETLAASGDRGEYLRYLLEHHVTGDLFKHLMVTLPITLRGMWAGKYLALAGVALMLPVGRDLARRGRLLAYLFLAGVLLFMAGLHGFVSVNVPRYNIPMIALYAFVVAFALVGLAQRVRGGSAILKTRRDEA